MLPLIVYVGSSFLLHLLWENLHGPLYLVGTTPPDTQRLLFATATGDMIFMLVIFAVLAMLHRDWLWVSKKTSYAKISTWIVAIAIGVLLGTSFELWAVHIDHRWTYAEAMPIIPVLGIGLSPVLQMVVVPVAVLAITSMITRRR